MVSLEAPQNKSQQFLLKQPSPVKDLLKYVWFYHNRP